MQTVTPVVLCGGAGSRLWPVSRPDCPKPLLPLGDGGALLLNATLTRLQQPIFSAPQLVCGQSHAAAVQQHASGVPCIVEPMPKGTAAAVLAAACHVGAGLVLVLPADHAVADAGALARAVEAGTAAALGGEIVVFGVQPDRPATGFGWIERGPGGVGGAFRVSTFHEKPTKERASAMLRAGAHLWNSGMFLFEASALLVEARRLEPALVDAVEQAVASGVMLNDHLLLDVTAFGGCRSVSFDVAIMERTQRASVVPVDMGWDDVGTWEAVWRLGRKDDAGNVQVGRVRLDDCSDSLVWSDGPAVVASGLRGMAVAASANGVLMVPRTRAQDVGAMAASSTLAVPRPWGAFVVVDRGPGFQVKRLTIDPGHRISEQRHAHRSELWTVVAGSAEVELNGDKVGLVGGDCITIPLGATHRLGNAGAVPLVVVEVQMGTYLEEDDIIRADDDYGRS